MDRHEWEQQKTCIEFTQLGALDYRESTKIEMSLTPINGFSEILPFDLMIKLSFPHLSLKIMSEFYKILGKIPHISDRPNSPKKDKFDKVYYRCYREYSHSHSKWGTKPSIAQLTLEEAIDYITSEELSLV